MHWNFQSARCMGKMRKKMMEGKAGVKKQNSKKGFEEDEHTCSVEGVFHCPSESKAGQPYAPSAA